MADFPLSPAINTALRQLETTDSVHANILNPMFEKLINNIAAIVDMIENTPPSSTGNLTSLFSGVVYADLTTWINELDKTLNGDIDVNVKSRRFGAIGDGQSHLLSSKYATLSEAQNFYPNATSLDNEIDWCAIQKAFDYAKDNGGGKVFIPAGKYLVDQGLKIEKTGISVYGVGNGLTIKGANNTTEPSTCIGTHIVASKSNLTETMLTIADPTLARVYNATVEGITFSSWQRNASASNGDGPWFKIGIWIDTSNLVKLRNLTVSYFDKQACVFGNALSDINGGPDQVMIDNCRFSLSDTGIDMSSWGHSTHIRGGSAEWNKNYGINCGGRNSIMIEDMDIEQNRNVGLRIYSGGNITVHNCTFENNAKNYTGGSAQSTHIWIGDFNMVRNVVVDKSYFLVKNMRSAIRIDRCDGFTLLPTNYFEGTDWLSSVNGGVIDLTGNPDDITDCWWPKVFTCSAPPYGDKYVTNSTYLMNNKIQAVSALPTASESNRFNIAAIKGSTGKQKVRLRFSNPCSTSGNITITLNGVDYQVAVDQTTDITSYFVASKVKAAQAIFTGWDVIQHSSTSDTITFVSQTTGTKSDPVYSGGTTGVTGAINVLEVGGTPTADVFYKCMKDASNNYSWVEF